jgi:hypothetical protein
MKRQILLAAICLLCSVHFYNAQDTTSTPATVTTSTAAPPATPGDYKVPNDPTVKPCLRVMMQNIFNIQYNTTTGTIASVSIPLVNSSSDFTFNGTCDDKGLDTLNITFNKGWFLAFEYAQTGADQKSYQLSTVLFNYIVDTTLFPNASELGPHFIKLENQTLFSTNKDSSYYCSAKQSVVLNNKVSMDISQYQGQAFMKTESDGKFSTAVDCDADNQNTNKIVPIVVGSALALLVILVLIAYVIGRRKHRPGYQQV